VTGSIRGIGFAIAKEFAENIDATILTKDFQKDKSKIY
jgi:NAD(P)-dependent dehydrogenase (short-subunit alcohol dehydrogenase family)